MTPDEVSFWQWALREGGAFVLIAVILFFYRRDWKNLTETTHQQYELTAKMLVEATVAQTRTAAALAENTVVVHGVKSVLRLHVPHRRDEDPGDA